MKKKLIGIFVCTLLIASVFPVVGGINNLEKENISFKRDINKNILLDSEKTQLKFMKAGNGLRFIRSYWLHVPPSYDGSESVPLVIVLHGSTGPVNRLVSNLLWWFGSSWIEDYTNFSLKADEEGFIVLYPNSKLMASNPFSLFFAFDVPIYPKYFILRKLVDDVGFIEEIIGQMQRDYNINSSRIYITGFSNGADFSYYLGSELSDKVAAIGPVAGAVAYKLEDDEEFNYIPEPENPVSVIVFHGTNDSAMPYEGDAWQLGVNESIAFWVEHNGCDPVPEINISESGRIIRRIYTNGSSGTDVILYTTVGGNHWWPGNNWPPENQWLYDPWKEISATDLIWEFFEMHPKQ